MAGIASQLQDGIPSLARPSGLAPDVPLLVENLVTARVVMAPPALSVVVPTRNEAGNVDALLDRLAPVVSELDAEVIFVDDSTDDTPNVIRRASGHFAGSLRLVHREIGERTGGLGGAVLAGLRAAQAPWVVVMDGDLQHPPEVIHDLYRRASTGGLDLVVASRYCPNGDAGSFGRVRSLISRASTIAARAAFFRRLRNVDDPMSGFFIVRRQALQLDALQPNGFKILLEIIGRTPGLRVASVPFRFGERFAEQSKASMREGLRFLHLLCTLRFGSRLANFSRFTLVGVSGLAVNSLLLAFWTETAGLFYLISLILATQGSTLWNFTLTEFWVFHQHRLSRGLVRRGALFFAMNNVALLARGPMVFGLTSLLGLNYLLSNVVSMAVLLLIRFVAADSVIWKRTPTGQSI
jgi:dolichol-phosphate mannosyltransferase